MPRLLPVLGLIIASAASLTGATPLQCSVDWSLPTGRVASGRHYGLSVFCAFNGQVAGTPGNSFYKTNVAYMKPGIIRYHNAYQPYDSTGNWSGWVISPSTSAYAWDRNKINNAMTGAYSFGPAVMMNIVRWPAYLNVSESDERLKTSSYGAFAAFCADLVRIVNIEQGRGVVYWEVLNEPEAHGYYSTMDEAARVYSVAVAAMKAVDPSIKVGGPAFGSPEVSSHRTKFISTVHALGAPLDFVSYHQYPDYKDKDFTASDATIWNQAAALGNITTTVRSTVAAYYDTPDQIELIHDEYNINWTYDETKTPMSEPRMANIKGAVWDALAMVSMINAGASATLAWNEADITFGKLDTSTYLMSKRPAAHVYRLFNETQIGEVVTATTSAASKVVVFAQRNGLSRQFCLINRSGASQTMVVAFGGWLGGDPGSGTTVSVQQVSSTGIATSATTVGALSGAAGIALPADTISFLTLSETPPATPSGLSATGADQRVRLSWQPVANATGYTICRADNAGGPFAVIATNVAGTAHDDTGLGVDTTYFYNVSADREALRSTASAAVAATTYTAVQAWRFSYFGTAESTGDAADNADPDHDGLSNQQEYVAKTDPTRGDSVFRITLERVGTANVVHFTGERGRLYRIERSETLAADSWIVLQDNIAGIGGAMSVTDSDATGKPRCFYRATVSLP